MKKTSKLFEGLFIGDLKLFPVWYLWNQQLCTQVFATGEEETNAIDEIFELFEIKWSPKDWFKLRFCPKQLNPLFKNLRVNAISSNDPKG